MNKLPHGIQYPQLFIHIMLKLTVVPVTKDLQVMPCNRGSYFEVQVEART